MWIGVLTLFPQMFDLHRQWGVVSRGIRQQQLTLECFNPRDYVDNKHRNIDDQPYGGGAGMVMQAQPLADTLLAAKAAAPAAAPVVLMSPAGHVFRQQTAVHYSTGEALILVCGRYEGIDERFIEQHVDLQWSIGDYVVSGGEIPAMVVIDAIARHIPGVLGNFRSIISESHLDGRLDYPQYTRPEMALNAPVPQALLSGDHKRVDEYRRREALGVTYQRRPDMLLQRQLDPGEREALTAHWAAIEDDGPAH